MRIAIISDIHGVKVALDAVLEDIEKKRLKGPGVDQIWCLGDTVGYGPEPLACLKTVRESCGEVLRGNHEDYAVQVHEEPNFPLKMLVGEKNGALQGVHLTLRQFYGNSRIIEGDFEGFTRGMLGQVKSVNLEQDVIQALMNEYRVSIPLSARFSSSALLNFVLREKKFEEMFRMKARMLEQKEEGDKLIEYVKNLPVRKDIDIDGVKIVISHDNPVCAGDAKYVLDPEHPDNERYMKDNISVQKVFDGWEKYCGDARFLFIGHSHQYGKWTQNGRWIANPSSVGIPRDSTSTNRASYIIVNTEAKSNPIYRYDVEFDVEKVRKQMADAGLPDKLGRKGGSLD